MYHHIKTLMYTVRIGQPDPRFGNMLLEQFGGANGELAANPPALAALTCPTTNSYHRLVPGFEAPINLAYSSRNRSAAVRIPMYSPSPKAKRIEVLSIPDAPAGDVIEFS